MAWRAGPTGVQDPGEPSRGVPRNTGRSAVSCVFSPCSRYGCRRTVKPQALRGSASFTGGSEGQDAARVSLGERNEPVRRAAEVGVSSLRQGTSAAGEPPQAPPRGRRAPGHRPLEGNMAGTSNPDTVSTRQQRIAELAEAGSADGIHVAESPPRSDVAARGFLANTPGWGCGSGRAVGGGLRSRCAGQPAKTSGPSQDRQLPCATRAQGAYFEGNGDRNPPHRDTNVRGQNPSTRGCNGIGADLRAGLSELLVWLPSRAIGALSNSWQALWQNVMAIGEKRLDFGRGHPEIFRHAGSCLHLRELLARRGAGRRAATTDR